MKKIKDFICICGLIIIIVMVGLVYLGFLVDFVR